VVEAFFALRDDELGSLGSLEETEAKESWGNENLWEESS
jgi:hypothetical protein